MSDTIATVQTTAAPALDDAQIAAALAHVVQEFSRQVRSPVFHDPSEAGLEFETVTFPAMDGVALEGWFIPAEGSDKLIIANHPMGFSRSGLTTQFEPWKSLWSRSGNTMEVNFIPDYQILHEAGYHVLCYDLRNHGMSGVGQHGGPTSGLFEARDVVGSIRYAKSRHTDADLQIALFSRCFGANSTLAAMAQYPAEFAGIRSLLAPMPVTTEIVVGRQLALAGVPEEKIADAIAWLDQELRIRTSVGFAARDTREWAKSAVVPTFLYQVRDDILTIPADVQAMYDNIPLTDKKLQWIENSTVRWDGYLEFQRRPQPGLDWFAAHWA